MTTEIKKTFFDTFEIPQLCCKKYITNCTKYGECEECVNYDKDFSTYPEITDHILLKLICILNNYGKNNTWAVSIENLKDCILMNCIKVIKEKDLKEMSLNNFKQQVRTLFEEK